MKIQPSGAGGKEELLISTESDWRLFERVADSKALMRRAHELLLKFEDAA